MFTEEQVERYLIDPSSCPYCGSDNITGGDISIEGTVAWQEVECEECDTRWFDDYTLTGISEKE